MAVVVALRALLPWRLSIRDGVPAAVALVLIGVGVPFVWSAMRGLDVTREQLLPPTSISAREKCLVDGGHGWSIDYVRWLDDRIPSDARVSYRGQIDPVCLQLNLLPRVLAADGERADYAVYANEPPPAVLAKLESEEKLPPEDRTVQRYEGSLLLVRER